MTSNNIKPHSPKSVADELLIGPVFDKVYAINELAGNARNQGHRISKHQMDIIDLEVDELRDGIDTNDLHEIIDGVGDGLFTLLGLAGRYGFDAAEVLRRVNESQFSKFDKNMDDLLDTRTKYTRLGVETFFIKKEYGGETVYVTKVSETATGTDGKTYLKGKWLKSVNFQEPRFDDMIELIIKQELKLRCSVEPTGSAPVSEWPVTLKSYMAKLDTDKQRSMLREAGFFLGEEGVIVNDLAAWAAAEAEAEAKESAADAEAVAAGMRGRGMSGIILAEEEMLRRQSNT